MTTTTTRPAPGIEELNWGEYLYEGDYTDNQRERLHNALIDALRAEVASRLPDGWAWYPYVSELLLPVTDRAVELDMGEILEQASEAVIARFEEIEAAALDAPSYHTPDVQGSRSRVR